MAYKQNDRDLAMATTGRNHGAVHEALSRPRRSCACTGDCGRHHGPCAALEGQLLLGSQLSHADRRRFGDSICVVLVTGPDGQLRCQRCASPQLSLVF